MSDKGNAWSDEFKIELMLKNSKGHTIKSMTEKQQQQHRLSIDIVNFLAKGGKITYVESGYCSDGSYMDRIEWRKQSIFEI